MRISDWSSDVCSSDLHEERERAERYRNERRDWQRRAQQRAHRLQLQRRMAKYRYQQQYHDRLRRQQVSWSTRSYNYYNDPYYYTPNRYRYSYQGNWQRTNRYGAEDRKSTRLTSSHSCASRMPSS